MKKMIYICDRCKEEVNWVYQMPLLKIEGLNINVYDGKTELCEKCARQLIAIKEDFEEGAL
jgi:hypothetical protein